jgi:hypothetical protein
MTPPCPAVWPRSTAGPSLWSRIRKAARTNKSLVGSPLTPYIWDDRCRAEDAAEQLMNVYSLVREERKARGLKYNKNVKNIDLMELHHLKKAKISLKQTTRGPILSLAHRQSYTGFQ